jgi:serine protease Do
MPLAAVLSLLATTAAWAQQPSSNAPAAKNPPAAPKNLSAHPKANASAEPEKSGGPPSQAPEVLQQLNSALEGLVAKVSPAVVQVVVTGYGPLEDKNQQDTALVARQRTIGSGVIVDSSGFIMTNAHVVEGAQRIRVILPVPSIDMPMQLAPVGKRQIFEAKLIGMDKDIDVALIKVNPRIPMPTLALASRRRVHQGQLVFAIGSPEGLQSTVTMGIVSSVARQPDPDKPMVYIQTDAPINPGNSGGPLVDMDGYVVGMNTFILSQAGGSEGLGFAIPARVVEFAYESLRKYGHVHRSAIQARAQTITPTLAAALGLPQNWGVMIADVLPGGPAEAAGLRIQDIVLAVDDRRIETLLVYTAMLYLHPADQVLRLDILRGTEKKTLFIPVLQEKHETDQLANLASAESNLVPVLAILGLDLDDKIRPLIPDLRNPLGVVVVARAADIMGPDTGLATGDIVHAVNRAPVDSLDSLRAALKTIKSGDPVALQIERQGHLLYLSFEME